MGMAWGRSCLVFNFVAKLGRQTLERKVDLRRNADSTRHQGLGYGHTLLAL